MMGIRPIRVLVVDDHSEVRRGICDRLGRYPDLQVVGTAEDGLGALDAAKKVSPDVLLLDVSLPGLNGIEVARKACRSTPSMRIIMLVEFDVEPVARAVRGNAHGCLLKGDSATTFAQAIRAVHRGEYWLPPPAPKTSQAIGSTRDG